MSEEDEFEMTEELRKAIHSEGFFCDDEIRKDSEGSIWVKMDFFQNMKKIMNSLMGEK
tara:strand:+ start:315 stop:488 length:174 start_codon:yes stop_codon:yes gene_type:complete